MFIELVDALRCPHAHEESWLVVASSRTQARHILDGVLGCPVCRSEYPIVDGVADFSEGNAIVTRSRTAPSGEQATRLAAFLGLDDATGFATLVGEWGTQAYELRDIAECPILLVDPPAEIVAAPGLSIIRTAGRALPMATGASRGVAVDPAARTDEGARVTKVKGRLVAPAGAPLPDGVRELARDAELWVGERESASSRPVALHVRRSGAPPAG